MSFLILACVLVVGQYLYIQAKANSFKDKSTKVVKAGTYKIYKDTNYEEILASIYENKELDNFDYFLMNNKTNFEDYLTSYEKHNNLKKLTYIVVQNNYCEEINADYFMIPLTKELSNVADVNDKDVKLTLEYTDFWTNLEGNATSVILALVYLQESSQYNLTQIYLE